MIQINLRKKFVVYFSPLILGILIFGVYCIVTFAGIHNSFNELQKEVTPSAFAMLELKEALLSLETGIQEKRIDQDQLNKQIKQLRKIVTNHEKHEKPILDPDKKSSHEMMHRTIRTMSLSQYILNQSETGWQDKDLVTILDIIHQERLDLEPILDEHLSVHLQQLAKTEEFVSKKYRSTVLLIGIFMAAMIILTFVTLMLLMRSILGPVKELQEGAKQIGTGNLDFNLQVSTGDELEFLADEFKDMATKLSKYHQQLDSKVKERTEELVKANEELKKEINEKEIAQEEQLRAEEQVHLLSQELIQVQENERQQIALDLHDNVAQELSSLKVACETSLKDISQNNQHLEQQVQKWEKLIDQCITTVRDLSYNLRPPGLEQMGLHTVISDYCRNCERNFEFKVDFSAAGMENISIDNRVAINIYRLIQEGLQNIHKHAEAGSAVIKLVASYPTIVIRIEDNGIGFDVEEGLQKALQGKRLGLLGMKERVRMLKGTIKIQSNLHDGTKILIEIPWKTANGKR